MTTSMRRIAFPISLALLLAACVSTPQETPETRLLQAAARASHLDSQNAPQPLEPNNTSEVLSAISRARAVVLDNLNHAQSPAFKAARATLEDKGQINLQYDFSQGTLQPTGRALDLAINGPGFFQVKLTSKSGDVSIAYTRNGRFVIDDYGNMTLATYACTLEPPLAFPAHTTDIFINKDGRVQIHKEGYPAKIDLGHILLARFLDPDGLLSLEPGLYLRSETTGPATLVYPGTHGAGTLQQGALESSNVDLPRETQRLHFLDQWRATLLHALGLPA